MGFFCPVPVPRCKITWIEKHKYQSNFRARKITQTWRISATAAHLHATLPHGHLGMEYNPPQSAKKKKIEKK